MLTTIVAWPLLECGIGRFPWRLFHFISPMQTINGVFILSFPDAQV